MQELTVPFVKYEACGNDYIIIDEREGQLVPDALRNRAAMVLIDRHFGVGADGVAYIAASDECDGRMQLIDSPNGEAYMCGNGIRCVAHFLSACTGKNNLSIDTRSGTKIAERTAGNPRHFRVHMGRLYRDPADLRDHLPADFDCGESLLDAEIDLPELGRTQLSIVHVGEPHVIVFTEDAGAEDMELYGRVITKSSEVFPNRVNVNLVEPLTDESIRVRTFEAGVFYETLSCGTGCVSSAAVAHMTGRVSGDPVEVVTGGGRLHVSLQEDELYMAGPARPVFRGMTRCFVRDERVSVDLQDAEVCASLPEGERSSK